MVADTTTVAATTVSASKARSLTGCWTCRLRKKKCDETPNKCLNCRSLQLDCHGYGPRPSWMDGGAQEKFKSQEIKAILNRNRKRRRLRSSSDQSRVEISKELIRPTHCRRSSEPAHLHVSKDGERFDQYSMARATTCDRMPFGSISEELPSSPMTSLYPLPTPPMSCSEMLSHSESHVLTTTPFNNNEFDIEFLEFSLRSPSIEWSRFNDEPDISKIWTFPNEALPTPADRLNVLSSQSSICANTMDKNVPTIPSSDDVDIHYYVHTILPSMLPFLSDDLSRQLNAKVMECIQDTSVFRSTIVAYSRSIRCTDLQRYGIPSLSDSVADTERSMTNSCRELSRQVKQMCTLQQESKSDQILCMVVLLLLIQIHKGKRFNRDLVQAIDGDLSQYKNFGGNDPKSTALLRGVLIVIETLSTSSHGTQMRLSDSNSTKIELPQDDSYVKDIIGCQAWVIQVVAEICALRNWKSTSQKSGRLNVFELVMKANQIERNIKCRLPDMAQTSHSLGCSHNLEYDTAVLTHVFAAAALVYLHVVVSGAQPGVENIRETVEATIDAIKMIRYPRMLRRLAWPICVAASLAEGQSETFFAQVEQGVRDERDDFSNLTRAFDIAAECRRMRKKRDLFLDWIDVSERLDHGWIMF